ncbi:MAG: alanine:cation symporter family protein, partial [Oscillospiraceae bacterium]
MDVILNKISGILWSLPLVILVLGAGIYFSIRMLFPQFRYLKEMFRIMSQGNDTKSGLSPVKSFIFTAARTVGVGNIAGMATAIYFGGPGAIFWLWILAIFGSGVALIEAILAQTFRVMSNGEYRGGP